MQFPGKISGLDPWSAHPGKQTLAGDGVCLPGIAGTLCDLSDRNHRAYNALVRKEIFVSPVPLVHPEQKS